MRDACERGHKETEGCDSEMPGDKLRRLRVQAGVEAMLQLGQVEAAILSVRMVAEHRER